MSITGPTLTDAGAEVPGEEHVAGDDDTLAKRKVSVGDRIAQMIVMPVPRVSFTRVD
ncbi:dUTP diphosphatase, partial [Bacillus sp. S34]|nr:dUTP diphosphatase [Bacillus sp. S34]